MARLLEICSTLLMGWDIQPGSLLAILHGLPIFAHPELTAVPKSCVGCDSNMPYQAHHKGSRGSPNSNSQWETVVTALPHITSSRHQVFKKPRSPPTSSIKLQRSAHEAALVHSTLTFRPPANALYASDHQRRRQKLRFSLVIPVSKFYQIYSSKFTMSQVINPGYYSANQAQYVSASHTEPNSFTKY